MGTTHGDHKPEEFLQAGWSRVSFSQLKEGSNISRPSASRTSSICATTIMTIQGPKRPGLNLYRVPMDAGKIKTADVVAALRFIKQSEGPVLIHCRHGSDRTGTISALHRIVFQN
jgi:hypothetical protein